MKLTEVQKHRIRTAYRESSEVLREIKQKTLKGKELADMKFLESAVQALEVFSL